MNLLRRGVAIALGIALPGLSISQVFAQTATVTLSSQKQYIRGFGGMVHIPWIGDLSAAERTLAFGNEAGQLGFTVLRIAVPESNTSDSSYVATAKAALAAGGLVFASPWNPPASMKSGGAIVASQFSAYAAHLNAFVSHMKAQGTPLYAISVQNEPDYANDWTKWTAAQCHDFVLNYGATITTKLMGCESFNYSKALYDPILNDSAALANMGVLGTHLYGTSVNNYAYPLFDQKAAGKIERWMTEHYTDSTTDANVWPNALGVATEIHNSMVTGQFSVYTWWYIKRFYGAINNGAVTKRGWCMAHWSKFVRPGFYRVDATASPMSGVSLSAYKSDTDVVLVAVNTSSSTQSITVSINGSTISSYDKYTTSSSKSMASDGKVTASNGALTLSLDGSSVTTLHGSGTITGAGGSSGTGGSSGSGGSTGGVSSDAGGARDSGSGGRAEAGASDASDARTAGSGGVQGSGGITSRDGAAGTGGSGGSTASGGTNGSGGSAGSGGSSGSGGDGSGGSQGGAAGQGGISGTGGSSSTVDVANANGCSCAVGGRTTGSALAMALLALAAVGLSLRRRRRTSSEPIR